MCVFSERCKAAAQMLKTKCQIQFHGSWTEIQMGFFLFFFFIKEEDEQSSNKQASTRLISAAF